MFKKFLALLLVVALTATIAVAGTLAYLQDQDEDVNVMTLGNVSIEQHEYQRAEGIAHNAGESGAGNGVKEGALVPFVQGQALYPAVPKNNEATDYTAEATDLFFWGDYVYSGTAGNGLWNDDKLSNVMDKMVFVENTGKSDAYFRTIIAFECPEGMEYSEGSDKEFMMNINGSDLYDWENVGYITVDGVRYLVEEATYQNALKPGQTGHPSLLQVVMTHNATNEDMELLGDTYEILVLSQAVQTEGFANAQIALDTAFGKAADNAATWFGADGFGIPTVAGSDEALKAALAQGGTVILNDSVNTDNIEVQSGAESVLDLNGETLTSDYVQSEGNLTIENGTLKSGTSAHYGGITVGVQASTTYNDVEVKSAGGGIGAADGAKVTFNSGSVEVNSTSTSGRYLFYAEGAGTEITINDGEFADFTQTSQNQKRAYIYAGAGTTVYVNGGTFGKASTREGYTEGIKGEGTVIIKGGTFGFNPSNWVADGYQAVESGGVWTVSAK